MRYNRATDPEQYLRGVLDEWKVHAIYNGGLHKAIAGVLHQNELLRRKIINLELELEWYKDLLSEDFAEPPERVGRESPLP